MREFEFPDRFDPELWYLEDCDNTGVSTKHYILGNGRTYPGRAASWCEKNDKIINVSLGEMEELSPKAKIWMEGFLVGNAPEYKVLPDDPYGYACWVKNSRYYQDYQNL